MQRHSLRRTLALMVSLVFMISAQAQDNTAAQDKAAADLASILQGYQSYQADFIQIVVNENGRSVQETKGALKARRPGLFYWESHSPMSQFIVSNGKTVEVYDPDLEQVTIHNLDEQVQTTPALLLSGEVSDLDKTYRVALRELGDDTREYTLEPRSPDSLFVSLRLTFFKGELQEMRMKDSLSQLSVLSFSHIRVNDEIDTSAFTLEYPEGVDIIRDGS